jgi:hypothetical protein
MVERQDFETAVSNSLNDLDLETRWRRWLARETERRALLAHYIIDGSLSSLFSAPPTVRHVVNPVICVADERIFMAESAESWEQECASNPHDAFQPLSTYYQSLLENTNPSTAHPLRALSTLNLHTMLEGLLSMIADWAENGGLGHGVTPLPVIADALVRFHDIFLADGSDISPLNAQWHSTCIYTIDKLGSASATSPQDVFDHPPGRRALLHAVSLRRIADSLPISSASMPHLTLPCSMRRGAVVLAQYLASDTHLRPHSAAERDFSLDEPPDWTALGSLGLPSMYPVDLPETIPAGNVHRQYIVHGGHSTLAGADLGSHSLHPFVTVLEVVGAVWPVCRSFAEELHTKA